MPLTGGKSVRSQEAGWSRLCWQALAFLLFISVKKLILITAATFERSRRFIAHLHVDGRVHDQYGDPAEGPKAYWP